MLQKTAALMSHRYRHTRLSGSPDSRQFQLISRVITPPCAEHCVYGSVDSNQITYLRSRELVSCRRHHADARRHSTSRQRTESRRRRHIGESIQANEVNVIKQLSIKCGKSLPLIYPFTRMYFYLMFLSVFPTTNVCNAVTVTINDSIKSVSIITRAATSNITATSTYPSNVPTRPVRGLCACLVCKVQQDKTDYLFSKEVRGLQQETPPASHFFFFDENVLAY